MDLWRTIKAKEMRGGYERDQQSKASKADQHTSKADHPKIGSRSPPPPERNPAPKVRGGKIGAGCP